MRYFAKKQTDLSLEVTVNVVSKDLGSDQLVLKV